MLYEVVRADILALFPVSGGKVCRFSALYVRYFEALPFNGLRKFSSILTCLFLFLNHD